MAIVREEGAMLWNCGRGRGEGRAHDKTSHMWEGAWELGMANEKNLIRSNAQAPLFPHLNSTH